MGRDCSPLFDRMLLCLLGRGPPPFKERELDSFDLKKKKLATHKQTGQWKPKRKGSTKGKLTKPSPLLFLALLFFPWVPLMESLLPRSLGRTRVPRHLVHCLGLQPHFTLPVKCWGGDRELVHWWGWFRMREGKEEVLTEARSLPSTVHQKGLKWPQPLPLLQQACFGPKQGFCLLD